MAYASTHAPSNRGGFITRLTEDLRSRNERRRVYKQTLRELRMLSDRELADLGLHYSQLSAIAWQAANER